MPCTGRTAPQKPGNGAEGSNLAKNGNRRVKIAQYTSQLEASGTFVPGSTGGLEPPLCFLIPREHFRTQDRSRLLNTTPPKAISEAGRYHTPTCRGQEHDFGRYHPGIPQPALAPTRFSRFCTEVPVVGISNRNFSEEETDSGD